MAGPIKCSMKEPNVHPACVARGRMFEPEGWQLAKRATTCKDCNSVRNAAYRASRKPGATEASVEAERVRARGGALASPGAPGAARPAREKGEGGGTRATVAGDGQFYLLHGSEIWESGKDKKGAVLYRARPAEVSVIDFRQPGVETEREGAEIVQCPRCGQRGEYKRPKEGWMDAIVTHRRALVGPGRHPRMLEYCAISRNHAASDALRDIDRAKRAAGAQEEAADA